MAKGSLREVQALLGKKKLAISKVKLLGVKSTNFNIKVMFVGGQNFRIKLFTDPKIISQDANGTGLLHKAVYYNHRCLFFVTGKYRIK